MWEGYITAKEVHSAGRVGMGMDMGHGTWTWT